MFPVIVYVKAPVEKLRIHPLILLSQTDFNLWLCSFQVEFPVLFKLQLQGQLRHYSKSSWQLFWYVQPFFRNHTFELLFQNFQKMWLYKMKMH